MSSLDIENKIKVVQLKLSIEKDEINRQELNKQLQKLRLKQEIENIKHRINQLDNQG